MSKFKAPAKEICAHCNTQVFFAERSSQDGNVLHTKCVKPWADINKKVPLMGIYPGDEDRLVKGPKIGGQ